MKCNKNKKRTFFNMFEIFTCSNCNKDYNYEYIYIGNNTINIYRLNNECVNNIKKQKMIKLFLKDSIINYNDLYLVLYYIEYIKIFDYLPVLMGDENINIYILII